MRRSPFSDDDRVFSGDLDPADAPPELAGVARLVRAARVVEPTHSLLAKEELLVSQIAEVVRGSRRIDAARGDRHHLLGRMLSAKVVGVGIAVLLCGGVAAAGTGALPHPVQAAVSQGLAHIGISVPDPGAHPRSVQPPAHGSTTRTAGTTPAPTHAPARATTRPATGIAGTAPAPAHAPARATTRPATGIAGTTPAPAHAPARASTATHHGLCIAYARAANTKTRANALSQLTAAAHRSGQTVAQYCAGATSPSTTVPANAGPAHRPTTASVPRSDHPGRATSRAPSGPLTPHASPSTNPGRNSATHRTTRPTPPETSKHSTARTVVPAPSRGKGSAAGTTTRNHDSNPGTRTRTRTRSGNGTSNTSVEQPMHGQGGGSATPAAGTSEHRTTPSMVPTPSGSKGSGGSTTTRVGSSRTSGATTTTATSPGSTAAPVAQPAHGRGRSSSASVVETGASSVGTTPRASPRA